MVISWAGSDHDNGSGAALSRSTSANHTRRAPRECLPISSDPRFQGDQCTGRLTGYKHRTNYEIATDRATIC
jgi:hypothetical protein